MVDAVVVEVLVIGLISLLTSFFAPQLCLLFTGGDVSLARTSAGHAQVVLMLCAFGFSGQMMSAYFESIGSTWRALLFGMLRYAVFAVPTIMLINVIAGIEYVWWALPIADASTFVITVAWLACERTRLLHGQACSAVTRAGAL